MTKVTILGSTGSIGRNTLEAIHHLKPEFTVVGLAAGRNISLLQEQVSRFKPRIVSVEREEEASELRNMFKDTSVNILSGEEGAEEVARHGENDIVVSAITGINGLKPTLAAVRSGKRLALANKESMVVAGPLIQDEARTSGSEIIPVDSEHSGIFQCLMKESRKGVKKVILTASGGPFFRTPLDEMNKITLEEALEHPRWNMGRKVTIDSATMMNKGLELIEAHWLFGLQSQELDILIHPQSIVHSLVEWRDGSVLAQLSPTDMKIPILFALTYPDRREAVLPSLDLSRVQRLEFFEVDLEKFPLVRLAREALEEGGSVPVVLNAANEVAVEAFLDKKISFTDIHELVASVVGDHQKSEVRSLEDILEIDQETRQNGLNFLEQRY